MAIQQTLQFGVVLAIAVQLGIVATAAASTELGGSYVAHDAEEYFVVRGHTARLECDLETFWTRASLSSPTGTVQARWLLKGAPLSRDDGRWKLYKNGTLVLLKLGKRLNATNAEGVYQCLAEHQRYGAVLIKTVNLKIAYLKEFRHQPDDMQALEGQPIIVPCSINSLPKAAVQWERDGVPLPQNKRYVPLPTGSLLITNVHSTDVGSYRCKVVNTILKKNKKSQAGYLSVASNLPGAPATGIIPLDEQPNITSVVGDDVTLYCITNGTRQPHIHWFNGKDIMVSNNSIFTIHNITRQQGGSYTCLVSAPEGSLKKIYHINVHQAPVFNSTPSSGIYVLAKNIRLNCTASGVPAPKIKWFKNGRAFEVESHIRTRQFDWGLLISSPTASDSGVYQCLAENQVGSAWTGASVRLNSSSNTPRKPWDINCLPYEAESMCLRWTAEPNVVAYTVIAHKTEPGVASEPLRDFVGNESFKLVEHLHPNTQYTFLIRTYLRQASDEFANVTCNTGVRGMRNLAVKLNTASSVTLHWEAMSSDFNPCNETTHYYQVQWRKITSDGVNSMDVTGFHVDIIGLISGEKYEFRVRSINSTRAFDVVKYSMPDQNELVAKPGEGNHLNSVYNETSDGTPTPPLQINANVLTANSINISWTDMNPLKTSYTLCYVQQDVRSNCEVNGKIIEDFDSTGKTVLLDNLRPRTNYEVRLQAHLGEQSSLFSHSFFISTPSDVPSEVQGLEYKVLTRTSACVKWAPPSHSNGRIIKYSVRHSMNLSLSVENWIQSSILMPRSNDGCWDYDSDEIVISTVLHGLDPDQSYYVKVFAVNDAGDGSITKPLTINTKYPFDGGFVAHDEIEGRKATQNDIYFRQGVGIAIGIGIAFIGIFACFGTFIIFKYLKRRMLSNRRFAQNGGSATRPKQVNGQRCHNAHELQQLVESNGNGHISMLPTTILDTKGGAEYPNGIYLNGHATNLRITENPQYYKKAKKQVDELSTLHSSDREYEEDSNSNLQKVCPITKSGCANGNGTLKTNGVDTNYTLNSTQSTVLLNDSVSSASSLRQPTLEPNG